MGRGGGRPWEGAGNVRILPKQSRFLQKRPGIKPHTLIMGPSGERRARWLGCKPLGLARPDVAQVA